MPGHKGPPPPHERENQRAFNTPENALKAIATTRERLASLAPGKVWRHRAPHGEPEIKASLMLDGIAVVLLHFSPEDGSLLPKGLHAIREGKPEILSLVQSRLQEIPRKLTILEGAEFREPESCWAIPLACEGRIVGHLKVSADGATIIADKKAVEDCARS